MIKHLFKLIENNDIDTISSLLSSNEFEYEETTLVSLSFFPEIMKLALANERCTKVSILVAINSAIISKNSELLSVILDYSHYPIKEDSYFAINSFILKSLSDSRLACFSIFMEKGYLLDIKTHTTDKVLESIYITSHLGIGSSISDKEHLYLLKHSSSNAINKHLEDFLTFQQTDFNENFYMRLNTFIHFFSNNNSKKDLTEYKNYISIERADINKSTQNTFIKTIENRLLFLNLEDNLPDKDIDSSQNKKI